MNRLQSLACGVMGIGCVLVACGAAVAESTIAEAIAAGTAPEGSAPANERSMLTNPLQPEAPQNQSPHVACRCGSEGDSAAVAKIEQALSGTLHSHGWEFAETPFHDFVNEIQGEYGIPIQFDYAALGEIGVNTDEPVTISIKNVSLRSALRLVLKRVQLTYVITDEVVLITTPDAAEANLKVCVYDVSDVIGKGNDQLDALVDAIRSCVARDTWAKDDGDGPAIRVVQPNLLVISHSTGVQEEVRELLDSVRKLRHAGGGTSEISGEGGSGTNAAQVVTRSYMLQLNPTNDVQAMQSQVRELITRALPKETWDGELSDGEGAMLTVFHDRIVVRHTAAVQRKVEKLLHDSGIAAPAAGGESGGMMGGLTPGGFGGLGAPGGSGFGGGFANPGLAPVEPAGDPKGTPGLPGATTP